MKEVTKEYINEQLNKPVYICGKTDIEDETKTLFYYPETNEYVVSYNNEEYSRDKYQDMAIYSYNTVETYYGKTIVERLEIARKAGIADRDASKKKLFEFIMENQGSITLDDRCFSIKRMEGVYYDSPIFKTNSDFDTDEDWNAYVKSYKDAIGVHTYCEVLRDENNAIFGLMSFYDVDGEEVKTKNCNYWEALINRIEIKEHT